MTRTDCVINAIQDIRDLPADRKWVGEGVAANAISTAEQRLGCRFPKPFISFLEAFGWGGPDPTEIFGLSERLGEVDYPNLVRENLKARREDDLPEDLLVFAGTGDGGRYVLGTGMQSDGAVRVWYPGRGLGMEDLEISDESFGEWLTRGVDLAHSTKDL
ncbi:SMI1/KNR4 family protein [Agrobacterium rubi]|nr:SMI1/KNR4 family protein [Agrobacterium rubi]NTF24308.1 SMI1/KNR4 family protein [Agrobacterium rubi]